MYILLCAPGIFPFIGVLIFEFGSLSLSLSLSLSRGGSLGDYLSTTCYISVAFISFCINWCIYVLIALFYLFLFLLHCTTVPRISIKCHSFVTCITNSVLDIDFSLSPRRVHSDTHTLYRISIKGHYYLQPACLYLLFSPRYLLFSLLEACTQTHTTHSLSVLQQ